MRGRILQLFEVFIIFRITISYGTNSIMILEPDITACLCGNNGTCNSEETTTISTHYKLASCNCPDFYDGNFDYD